MAVPKRKSSDRQAFPTVIAAFCVVIIVAIVLRSSISTSNSRDEVPLLLSSSHEGVTVRHTKLRQSLASTTRRSTKLPPVSCRDIVTMDRNAPREVSDPNRGIMHGRYTTTKPSFWISLHNKAFDGTRWGVMEFGFYYEQLQSQAFVEVLTQTSSQHVHVVDVGGNIGWYSLMSIAAAQSMNKSIVVDVFEPNPRNRLRFCESLQLNSWIDNAKVLVNLYAAGVSSTSGGSVSMSISESGTGTLGMFDPTNQTETVTFPLIALDDLADELGWDGAHIMKVDVEGLELEVFQGAKRFLQTRRVQNIFFEGNTRVDLEIVKFQTIIKVLIETGHYAYKFGAWMGPDKLVSTPVNDRLMANKIGDDVIKQYTESLMKQCRGKENTTDQCNLWWRPRPTTS